MSVPDVSVVIPTHDRASLLGAAVSSVLRQDEVELEVLVVDDGSTGGPERRVPELADVRVRVLRHGRSLGVSTARNRGIAAASAEWVAFLDDDDVWAPSKLARQLSACRAAGALWSFCGAAAAGPDLEVLASGPPPSGERALGQLPFSNPIPAGASNVLVRRDILEEPAFDPALRHLADWDLWIRLTRHGEPAVVPEPLVAYRVHPGNASLDHEGLLAEAEVIQERYRSARRGRPIDRAHIHRWIAWSCLRAGDRKGALTAYVQAVRLGDLRSLLRAAVGMTYPAITRRYQTVRSTGAQLAWLMDAGPR